MSAHVTSNNPQSGYVPHIFQNKHQYIPLNTAVSLLHTAYRGQWMTSLQNFYIQLFQRYKMIKSGQSQKDSNPLFGLVCVTQLAHTCTWPPPNSPISVQSGSCASNVNTLLLGAYFTDSRQPPRLIITLHNFYLSVYYQLTPTHTHFFLSVWW